MRKRVRVHLAIAATFMLVGLVVASGCSSTQPLDEQMDDARIATSIKAKFAANEHINPFNINVDAQEGVVTLNGRVQDQETKDEALRIARETNGVVRVIDLIRVGDRQN